MNSTNTSLKINTSPQQMNIFELVAIVFFSAYYILPAVSNILPIAFFTILALAYVGLIFLTNKQHHIFILVFLFLVVWISSMYFLLTQTSTISTSVDNFQFKRFMSKFFQYFLMFFPAIPAIRILTCANKNQQKLILAIISVLIIFVILITMRELKINPDITRTWDSEAEKTSENVASYYFVYAIPIIISLLLLFVFSEKTKMFKIAMVALIIFGFVFLLRAQYTLSILMTLLGLIIGVIKGCENKNLRFLLVILSILLILFLPNIFGFISSNVRSAQVSVRFRELANFFSTGDATGYNLDGRLSLYWKSIKAFFASPLYGNEYLDFDGHATFLTVLSDTGILGGIPFYTLYFIFRNKIKSYLDSEAHYFDIPFLMLVIIGLTNPIHAAFPVGFAIWLICPLIIRLITQEEKTMEETRIAELEN
jgi:hypothetical protein